MAEKPKAEYRHPEVPPMMPLFLAMFLAVGGLLICMSIPLIQRKVAPNRWYGFRVRRTLEHPNVWYPANAYAAWRMLWAAVAAMIVALGAYFVPGVELAVYASIVFAAFVIGLVIGLVQSFIYLRRLTDDKTKAKPDGYSAA